MVVFDGSLSYSSHNCGTIHNAKCKMSKCTKYKVQRSFFRFFRFFRFFPLNIESLNHWIMESLNHWMVIINNIVTDKIVSGAAKLQENGRVSWPPQPGVSEVKSWSRAPVQWFSQSRVREETGETESETLVPSTIVALQTLPGVCLSVCLPPSFFTLSHL
jgi:hypothetical protein